MKVGALRKTGACLPRGVRRIVLGFALATCLGGAAKACESVTIEGDGIFAAPLCLPQSPERVVVLDPGLGLGIGLDAGLSIVGAPLERMSDAALRDRAERAGITSIGFVTEPSLETIVALEPDMIVGFIGSASMASGIYPQVSQLAPTLLYTDTDWRAFYRLIAGFTGQTDEVAARLDTFDARLADIRERLPDLSVSVVRITSWDFQVYLDAPETYAPFEIMREAGVRRTPYETTDNPKIAMKRPDWEDLGRLDGDILLYIAGGTNDSDKDGRLEEVLTNPLWQMLPAVQAGRTYRVEHGHWMQFSGLAAAHRVLDDLERYVIGGQ